MIAGPARYCPLVKRKGEHFMDFDTLSAIEELRLEILARLDQQDAILREWLARQTPPPGEDKPAERASELL